MPGNSDIVLILLIQLLHIGLDIIEVVLDVIEHFEQLGPSFIRRGHTPCLNSIGDNLLQQMGVAFQIGYQVQNRPLKTINAVIDLDRKNQLIDHILYVPLKMPDQEGFRACVLQKRSIVPFDPGIHDLDVCQEPLGAGIGILNTDQSILGHIPYLLEIRECVDHMAGLVLCSGQIVEKNGKLLAILGKKDRLSQMIAAFVRVDPAALQK